MIDFLIIAARIVPVMKTGQSREFAASFEMQAKGFARRGRD